MKEYCSRAYAIVISSSGYYKSTYHDLSGLKLFDISKQVYNEARKVFYGRNTFRFTLSTFNLDLENFSALADFLHARPIESRKLLRILKINLFHLQTEWRRDARPKLQP